MKCVIEEYHKQRDNETKERLDHVYKVFKNELSLLNIDADEVINYGMPTFKYKGNLIHYAAFKNHIGIYPGPETIEFFSLSLDDYAFSKGAIQIKNSQEIDDQLLIDIIRYRVSLLK